MKKPSFLQFAITKEDDGGYVAQAAGHAIVTQGDTLDELMRNIREATECHFDANDVAVPLRSFPILANVEVPVFA